MLGELYGRSYGGGVLDVKVYEARQTPALNPLELLLSAWSRVDKAFEQLVEAVDLRCKAEEEL